MKPWLFALAILLNQSLCAWAENIGADADDERMVYVDDNGDVQYVNSAPRPAARPEPVATPAPATSRRRKSRGCRVPDNGVRSSPVKVYVDQSLQTISVKIYDEDGSVIEQHSGRVTTGGGLKIPNGKVKRDPYCAVTPTLNRKLIRAISPDDFGADSGCTPDQIRYHSTVFDVYRSATFTDAAGNPAPMAHAIRVEGGAFFHTAGREYMSLLGTENLSGGCIRLGPKMAAWLQEQMELYGAIEVTVSPKPEITDRQDRRYCDRNMEIAAKLGRDANQIQTGYYTGTEGVYQGGAQGMQDLLQSLGRLPGQFFDTITSPFRGQ